VWRDLFNRVASEESFVSRCDVLKNENKFVIPPEGGTTNDILRRFTMSTRKTATRLKIKIFPMMRLFARSLAALSLLWVVSMPVTSGDVADKRACQRGEPHCVHFVIQEMERRYRKLAKDCDHNSIFSLVYLRTTEKFRDTVSSTGYSDPSSIFRQDAVFADYYFRAYDAYHKGEGVVPPAWQIAFDAAAQRNVISGGDGLLGINAHINRDLPFVLFDIDRQGHPVSHEDHTLVNNVLAQVMVDAEIASRFDPTYDDNPNPNILPQIFFWRERAYNNYLRLRDAPTAEARAAVAAEIELIASLTAQAIIQTTALPPGSDSSARDAYCAENRK
jgi:hypothetical protein